MSLLSSTLLVFFSGYKDVLPIHNFSKVIYQFECRNCEQRYVGRTILRLKERVRQHIPRALLTDEALVSRPKLGRPRRQREDKMELAQAPHGERPPAKPPDMNTATVPLPSRRSARLSKEAPELKKFSANESAVCRHLVQNVDCRRCFRDSDFSVLCRARSWKHLEVLEAIYISIHHPVLCVQKSHLSLSLYAKLSR